MSFLSVGLFVLPAGPAYADSTALEKRRDEWPLTLALTSESLGYHPGALHPGAEVGTELRYLRRGPYELVQSVRLGFVHHPDLMIGGYLGTSLVNRLVASLGLYGELGLGVGYQLTVIPRTTYVASSGAQAVVAGGNGPRSMARVAASLALGYDFLAVGVPGLRVFVQYTQALLGPFAPGISLPLFVTSQLALGVSLPLSQGARP